MQVPEEPVIVSGLEGLLVAAGRRQFMSGRMEPKREPKREPTIEGMTFLLVKRRPLQMYFRDGLIHILVREGVQIQGHGVSLFRALADAVRNLKAFAKRNAIVYYEIIEDIETYERHYGEII